MNTNSSGQIEKESVLGVTILYEYNNTGQKVSRIFESQKIKYKYNANLLLIREIVSGVSAETRTYEYE